MCVGGGGGGSWGGRHLLVLVVKTKVTVTERDRNNSGNRTDRSNSVSSYDMERSNRFELWHYFALILPSRLNGRNKRSYLQLWHRQNLQWLQIQYRQVNRQVTRINKVNRRLTRTNKVKRRLTRTI